MSENDAEDGQEPARLGAWNRGLGGQILAVGHVIWLLRLLQASPRLNAVGRIVGEILGLSATRMEQLAAACRLARDQPGNGLTAETRAAIDAALRGQ